MATIFIVIAPPYKKIAIFDYFLLLKWKKVLHFRSNRSNIIKVVNGSLAQLVEQRTLNPWVEGSSPSGSIYESYEIWIVLKTLVNQRFGHFSLQWFLTVFSGFTQISRKYHVKIEVLNLTAPRGL